MRIKETLSFLGKSFLPHTYRRQSAHPLPVLIRKTLFFLFVAILLSFLVALPTIIKVPAAIEHVSSSFQTATINITIEAEKEVMLLENPRIRYSPTRSKENMTTENVLLNEEGVHRQKGILWWKHISTTTWDDIAHAPQNMSDQGQLIVILLLLIVPSVLISLFLVGVLEGIALILLSVVIGKIISMISSFSISIRHIAKCSIIALIPFYFVQFIPLRYFQNPLVALILFILVLSSALWFVGEGKSEKSLHTHPAKKKSKKKAKQDDDVVSIDEHGNLKK